MATYFGTTINDSPTIKMAAKAAIANAQAIAVEVDVTTGQVQLPAAAGNAVIGVIPLSENESIAAGEEVTIQIKDIGQWVAGAAVKVGQPLMADAAGKAVPATAGKFIVGYALSAAAAAGTRIRFQMTKSGFVPAS